MSHSRPLTFVLISLLVVAAAGGVFAQGDGPGIPAAPGAPLALPATGFTYQGQLNNGGTPVDDTCGFEFQLWDALGGGAQLGSTQAVGPVSVTEGRFTVVLNTGGAFGPRAFDGSARWLAIDVRCPAGGGAYTNLTPRQALTASPLAFALPGLWTELTAGTPNVIGGHISNTAGAGAFALGRRRVA